SPATSSCAAFFNTCCPKASTRSATSACGILATATSPPVPGSCCCSIDPSHRRPQPPPSLRRPQPMTTPPTPDPQNRPSARIAISATFSSFAGSRRETLWGRDPPPTPLPQPSTARAPHATASRCASFTRRLSEPHSRPWPTSYFRPVPRHNPAHTQPSPSFPPGQPSRRPADHLKIPYPCGELRSTSVQQSFRIGERRENS